MLWVPKPVIVSQGPHFGYLNSNLMLRWEGPFNKDVKGEGLEKITSEYEMS